MHIYYMTATKHKKIMHENFSWNTVSQCITVYGSSPQIFSGTSILCGTYMALGSTVLVVIQSKAPLYFPLF